MRQWVLKNKLFFENFLLIMIFVQLSGKSPAQEYCWPTDAGQILTSTFCEYRPGHFHAGLDVKTWGRTGYKVFALQRGSITRIDVSPYGYGRAVFLKMEDGKTVVYGHLSRFSDRLEPFVREEQNRRGRYSIELTFDPGFMTVEKGDVVAFTGATGNGVPHLHFEVWDEEDRPINPLSLGFDIEDTIPPIFEALAVTPLSYGSHAAGDYLPQVIPLHRDKNGLYRPGDPIYAWGRVGLSVRLYDRTNGAINPMAIYRLRLFVDGQQIHEVAHDWFPPDLTEQIDLDYEYRLKEWDKGHFQKLYREQWNRLPIYSQNIRKSGVLSCWINGMNSRNNSMEVKDAGDLEQDISLSRGDHTFRIEAFDYFGNRTEAVGTIRFVPASEFRTDENAVLSAKADSNSASFHFFDIDTHFFRETIRFSVQAGVSLSGIPSLTTAYNMWDRDIVPLIPWGNNTFIGSASWKNRGEGFFVMEVRGIRDSAEMVVIRDTMDVFLVTPEVGGSLVSPDGIFRMTYPEDAVYERLLSTVHQTEVNIPPAVIPNQYFISASDAVLKRRVKVQVSLPVFEREEMTLGIYSIGEKGAHFLSNRRENGKLTAWTRSTGPFTVLQDTVPPEIISIQPRPGSQIDKRTPRIMVSFKDTLSGIYGEDNYLISLDHSRLIVEYDPDHDIGFHQIQEPLSPGSHLLDILIRDKAGNVTEKQTQFTIR